MQRSAAFRLICSHVPVLLYTRCVRNRTCRHGYATLFCANTLSQWISLRWSCSQSRFVYERNLNNSDVKCLMSPVTVSFLLLQLKCVSVLRWLVSVASWKQWAAGTDGYTVGSDLFGFIFLDLCVRVGVFLCLYSGCTVDCWGLLWSHFL